MKNIFIAYLIIYCGICCPEDNSQHIDSKINSVLYRLKKAVFKTCSSFNSCGSCNPCSIVTNFMNNAFKVNSLVTDSLAVVRDTEVTGTLAIGGDLSQAGIKVQTQGLWAFGSFCTGNTPIALQRNEFVPFVHDQLLCNIIHQNDSGVNICTQVDICKRQNTKVGIRVSGTYYISVAGQAIDPVSDGVNVQLYLVITDGINVGFSKYLTPQLFISDDFPRVVQPISGSYIVKLFEGQIIQIIVATGSSVTLKNLRMNVMRLYDLV